MFKLCLNISYAFSFFILNSCLDCLQIWFLNENITKIIKILNIFLNTCSLSEVLKERLLFFVYWKCSVKVRDFLVHELQQKSPAYGDKESLDRFG